MYAVVDIGGKQWKVTKADTIRVPSLDAAAEKTVSFDQVLLVVDKESVHVGKPFIRDAKVHCTVLNHGKADKVKVFKKKRRKDYQVLKGHRQGYTEIRVDKIQFGKSAKDEKSPAAPKAKANAPAPVSPAAKKTASPAKKTEAVKKSTVTKSSAPVKKTAKPSTGAAKKSASSKSPAKTTNSKTSGTKKEG